MNVNQPLPEEASFEESMARLETLVERLERDDVGLDQAIRSYEEGVALAKRCLDQLSAAELRVQELSFEVENPHREP